MAWDLEPLDGVNDPWRWHSTRLSWVGPAFAASWSSGDHTAELLLPGGVFSPALFITTETSFAAASTQAEGVPWSVVVPETGTPVSPEGGASGFGFNPDDAGDMRLLAVGDGTGTVFLEQYETGFGGPTAVPVPGFDVLDYLGDVVAGEARVWDEDAPAAEPAAGAATMRDLGIVPWAPRGPWPNWSGPGPSGDGEQVANAFEDFVNLAPASQAAAVQTRANWAALLPQTQPEETDRGTDD